MAKLSTKPKTTNSMKEGLKLSKEQIPDRYQIIDKCQVDLWKLKKELASYSTLFCSIGSSQTLSGGSLYGTGLALKRASKKLDRVNDLLSEIYLGEES